MSFHTPRIHLHLSGETEKRADQTHSALNYSQHTTLFTLADWRHVRSESLIPTSCEREIESTTRARRRCLADISPVLLVTKRTRRRRRDIGGTRADADSPTIAMSRTA